MPDRRRPPRGRAGAVPRDEPRLAAFEVQRAVEVDGAYANLVLPGLLAERGVSGRDAALATELGYGTARAAGALDVVLAASVDRPLDQLDLPVRLLLRLGAYQLLRTRIPAHAAVATTVDLARATGNGRAAGLLNAVLRSVSRRDWDGWVDLLTADATPVQRLALRYAHPEWITAAFADALSDDVSGALAETEAALAADEVRPLTHLVAWPGRIDRSALLSQSGGVPGPYSPFAVRMAGGNPADLEAVRHREAAVQDEGSQLCALALADAPLTGRDERWLDLCAGPGGKTALLAALAAQRGATVVANELHPHRADLVRSATVAWQVEVLVGDARTLPEQSGAAGRWEGTFDRVLLDAPCTGLGALRRRPEARWRRTAADVEPLAGLQRDLLAAALRLVRPGGVVGYVTCSPHPAETSAVVAGCELLDARDLFPGVADLGPGPTVQLWPHRHGTDAMFCALLRRS